jgi:hypothetical protein
MVFKKGNTNITNMQFQYEGKNLNVVKSFTYLGVKLSSNGNMFQAQKVLSEQAMKALFSLNSLFDSMPLGITEKIKLFDSMISPILLYGSEIWGFHKAADIERVHLKFLKQLLGVKQQTPNVAVLGEFGRFPMDVMRKIRIIKYWFKVMKTPNSLVFKIMFAKDINGNFLNEWTVNVNKLLHELGFAYMCNLNNISENHVNMIIQRIYDNYLQKWSSDLELSPKLDSYKIFKNAFEHEKYLDCVVNNLHRTSLSRFRCSAHRLAIEEGRFRNIARQNRICHKCNSNQVESEYHFLLVCPYYYELRLKTLPKYFITWPTIYKFKNIMKSKSISIMKKLAKFIYLATEKRNI